MIRAADSIEITHTRSLCGGWLRHDSEKTMSRPRAASGFLNGWVGWGFHGEIATTMQWANALEGRSHARNDSFPRRTACEVARNQSDSVSALPLAPLLLPAHRTTSGPRTSTPRSSCCLLQRWDHQPASKSPLNSCLATSITRVGSVMKTSAGSPPSSNACGE